jgi:uncharacterized repeat protein (TIGR01451 family)
MKTITHISGVLLLALFSNQVMADIELSTTAQVEVTETNAQGEKVVKRQPAKQVVPGKEVIYTIRAKNTGAEPAGSIVVTNPIPNQTVYVDGSAFGSGTEITFSVDGGKNYGKPGQLTVKTADGTTRPATAQDYTHVRWTFQFELQPGQEAPVWYRVRVK